jgi:hypothetical protein
MSLFSLLHQWMTSRPQARRQTLPHPGRNFRPRLEALERREVLSFASPVSYAAVPSSAMVVADLNGDGKPDLVTLTKSTGLGQSNGVIQVRQNNGDGTFGAGRTLPVVGGIAAPVTTAVTVGDVNGDGKPDIVFADWSRTTLTSTIGVWLGDGQGGFSLGPLSTRTLPPFVASFSSLAVAHLGGLGTNVVAVPASGGSVYVANYLNAGTGAWTNLQRYSIPSINNWTSNPVQLAVGDVNGDGKPDLVVTTPGASTSYVSVLLNTGNSLTAAKTYAVGGIPTALAVGDVNGDGKPDIVTANANGTVSVLAGLNNGTFAATQNDAVGGPANSLALADVNHDGRLDIVTTGTTETDVLLNSDGGFAAYQKVGPAGSKVVAADFNGDGFPDLALLDASGSALDVLLNNADWGK